MIGAHTMFSASPFRPKGFTQAVIPAHRLGVSADDVIDIGLDDLNEGTVGELLGELDGALAAIPLGPLKSDYEARRTACLAKTNVVSKGTCLYELFQDVKRAIRDGEGAAPVKTPTTPSTPQPTESEFPWVPVGIAAGIGTAALLYFVLRQKTPPNGGQKKK